MTITKTRDGATLTLALTGRLDAVSAAELGQQVEALEADITKLVLDFAGVEYISSAGLRIILLAQKKMNRQGVMLLRHVGEPVMEVFTMTGFSDILVIEKKPQNKMQRTGPIGRSVFRLEDAAVAIL